MSEKYPVLRFILLIGEIMCISLMYGVAGHQGSGSVFHFIAFAFLYRETALVVDFPLSLAIIAQKPCFYSSQKREELPTPTVTFSLKVGVLMRLSRILLIH